MRKQVIYIVLLVVFSLVYLFMELSKPKPIDWSEDYSRYQKKPYGCYVLFDVLPKIFPEKTHSRKRLVVLSGA